MSKIKEIREAIDTKMDKWEASATAIEAQLQLSKGQAIEEFEVRKKRLNVTLEEFKSEIVKAKGLADEKKTEIQARFDELQVQLALGKAEARDVFEAQRKKIQHSIAILEATVDRHLDAAGHAIDDSFDRAADKFVAAAIQYEAASEALEARLFMKEVEAKAEFENKKKDFLAQISKFKTQLQGKRDMAGDKAAIFEKELSAGISQIKQAFKTLAD